MNCGEAYHRFRRAIAYVNSGKFRVQTEADLHAEEDARHASTTKTRADASLQK
ncbi:MAG: hypothetical protein EPN58_05905 [Rhodanobacter sp.]|nr:MAG: hypothetical protein EPN58_05905 [Rhodanobacter sp.]